MTNQVNTLTNQDVMLDLYKIHAYIPNDAAGNTLTPFGNFCEGYQAATQASESQINSLKQRVAGLQADNLRLRDALTQLTALKFSNASHIQKLDAVAKIANKALSSTPTQSLAEHDNEVIERCAQLSDACAYMSPNFNALSEEIRALKVTP